MIPTRCMAGPGEGIYIYIEESESIALLEDRIHVAIGYCILLI